MENGQREGAIQSMLDHLATLLAGGMVSALLLAVSIGIPYVLFPDDTALRQTIYSLTGQVFWINFYVLFGLGASIVLIGVDFERRIKGKIYFQIDKLLMAAKLYQDANSTSDDRASSVAMGVVAIAFSTSFGLEMGLGVLKSFIFK
jgi:hypothetical protein